MIRVMFDKRFAGKAVICRTLSDAEALLKMADSVGYKWADGDSLAVTNWVDEKDKTCYEFYPDNSKVMYGNETQVDEPKVFFSLEPKTILEDGFVLETKAGKFVVLVRTKTVYHIGNGQVAITLSTYDTTLKQRNRRANFYDVLKIYDRQNNVVWEREDEGETVQTMLALLQKIQEDLSKIKEELL